MLLVIANNLLQLIRRSQINNQKDISDGKTISHCDEMPVTFVYHGFSMFPTLIDFDRVSVKKCSVDQVSPGDIIVFHNLNNDGYIIHRAISKSIKGIITRGDGMKRKDSALVTDNNIVGQALSIERDDRLIRIVGGRPTLLKTSAKRLMRKPAKALFDFKDFISMALHCFLGKLGFIKPFPQERVITLKTSNGTELRLMSGRKVIGWLMPDSDKWRIRRINRPFINISKLPRRDDFLLEQ